MTVRKYTTNTPPSTNNTILSSRKMLSYSKKTKGLVISSLKNEDYLMKTTD